MGIKSGETSFPIVGIGASAGGLNALECFIGELPRDFGFSVVFMQHLSARHKSLLPDLLHNRRPDLAIVEITDGLDILPGKIYLCPPGKDVGIREGIFHVEPSDSKGPVRLPIDEFFASLAEEAGERVIAVLFSGAGTDGARGIQAIRNAGGTVFVQDPATAEFPAMPAAAIDTGYADGVLPPEEIAREILRLYDTGAVAAPTENVIAPVPFTAERAASVPPRQTPPAEHILSAIEIVQETLLGEFAPAAVAINQNYDVLYHNGHTNRYLRQPRGAPTQNLLELLPEGLRNRVRGAIYRAKQEARPVSIRTSMRGDDEKKRQVTLRISKLRENLFLVLFREKGGIPEQTDAVAAEVSAVDEAAVRQLEGELAATRAELQTNIEQLKSLNEELQSSNEELQASNEELETSREELQSLNEEMITVNAQLQSKIEEQEETNNDLNNFLSSTNIPTIFLDHQFRLKRFTPAMSRLLKLIPSDIGRPIIDMSQENLGSGLISDARAVLEDLAPVKKEIAIGGSWYIRVTLPYRTADNRIEGVVITYNDVSDLKLAEERTRHLASFPRLNPNPVLELSAPGEIVFSNAAVQRVLEGLDMGKTDPAVFLPHDIDNILKELEKKKELSLYREVEIKGKVFSETINLIPQFNVVRIYTYDITERRLAEKVMQARLRMAAAAYTGEISVDSLLRLTLDELEALTGSQIGFYHYLEEDQETLSLQNWSTNTVKTMCTAEGSGSHYNISLAGVWVDCVRERRPVIHNDYVSLPHRRGMPPGHAPVIREMVVPIMRGDRIMAIIGIGNKKTDYTTADIEIVQLLGDFSWEIVERKRAEEALRASWERSRSFVEITGQLGWTTNADGEVVEDLPLWRAYTGLTYDEIKGWGWANALHPDDVANTSQAWRKAVAEKCTYEVEYRIRRHDGIYRHFLARGIPVLKEDGNVREWVGTCIDITERKIAEEALRQSEQRLKRAQEIAHLGSWELDLVNNILTWSDEVYRIFGLRPQEFAATYEAFLERVHPDDRAAVDAAYSRSIRDGKDSYEIEHRIFTKQTGELRIIHEKCEHFRDGTGRIVRSVGMVHDVTERKKAEEEIRRHNAILTGINTIFKEALTCETDEELARACLRIAEGLTDSKFGFIGEIGPDGLLHDIAISDPGWELCTMYDKTGHRRPPGDFKLHGIYGRVLLDGKAFYSNDPASHPDSIGTPEGHPPLETFLGVPLILGGETIGMIAVGNRNGGYRQEDLDDLEALAAAIVQAIMRKRAEADVLKLGEDMAARNVDLELVNKELESFIYSISHDLRAPLRSVSGFAKILVDDFAAALGKTGNDYITRILRGSERMKRLIDDLLRLSKISRQEMERAEVNISGKASALAAELRESEPGRSVEIDIEEGLSAYADPRLIEIVLSNLLGNAWKFTSKTENARVEFGAMGNSPIHPSREGIVYYVRDNGAGFDPRYMEKMFWPFQRLHSEKEFEGTGIGLAIVERIIRRHGGRIWAEGEVGKGATVYFTLE